MELFRWKLWHTPEPVIGLRKRSELHLARKFFHMSGAVLLLYPYLVLHFNREAMAAMVGTVLAFVMSLEYSRARWAWVNRIAVKFFRPLLRDTEVDRISGIPFYMASALFSFLVFPHHIAVLAILYLAFGDPSSSFFGVLYGRNKLFPNKSLQGTLGGFFVCAAVTVGYFLWAGLPLDKIFVMMLLGGFAGAVAELLPMNVDDNFAIPLISGAILLLAFWAAEIPMG